MMDVNEPRALRIVQLVQSFELSDREDDPTAFRIAGNSFSFGSVVSAYRHSIVDGNFYLSRAGGWIKGSIFLLAPPLTSSQESESSSAPAFLFCDQRLVS